MSMLTITDDQVLSLITAEAAVHAVTAAHVRLSLGGTTVVPVPQRAAVPASDAAFLGMSAVDRVSGLAVMKYLADIPSNARRGLPAQRSMILAVSVDDGTPLALVSGGAVTRLRTAAMSAVATDALARTGAATLGLIGAGGLAMAHVDTVRTVRDLDRVVIWGRTRSRADELAQRIRATGIDAEVLDGPEDVVRTADIVCTLTPSRDPILEGAWLRAGQHLNVVGAPPRADHREVDSVAMQRARVVLDVRESALEESGDLLIPLAEGAIALADIGPDLGDVLTGRASGRTSADEITLFNSLGSGLQDLALVRVLLEERGVLPRAES